VHEDSMQTLPHKVKNQIHHTDVTIAVKILERVICQGCSLGLEVSVLTRSLDCMLQRLGLMELRGTSHLKEKMKCLSLMTIVLETKSVQNAISLEQLDAVHWWHWH
jgi:hypothetical protein